MECNGLVLLNFGSMKQTAFELIHYHSFKKIDEHKSRIQTQRHNQDQNSYYHNNNKRSANNNYLILTLFLTCLFSMIYHYNGILI